MKPPCGCKPILVDVFPDGVKTFYYKIKAGKFESKSVYLNGNTSHCLNMFPTLAAARNRCWAHYWSRQKNKKK